MKRLLQTDQLPAFALCQPCDRNLRPLRDCDGDVLRRDGPCAPADPLGMPGCLFLQRLDSGVDFPRLLKIARRQSGFQLSSETGKIPCLLLRLPVFLVIGLKLPPGAGLIHQINRLVRQKPVCHIPSAQLYAGFDRFVRNLHLMVLLVCRPDPLENPDTLLRCRLLDQNRLKTPLQRGILLDMLSVLIDRGRPDHLNLSAREHRLHDIRRVQRTFRAPRADDGVNLVNEKQHVTAVRRLLHGALDAFLKISPELGAGDHTRNVQHDQPLSLQRVRDISPDNPLGKSLDDRCLSHTRFTDQAGIILCLPAEDAADPLRLLLPAHHRVNLSGPDVLRQVPRILIQRRSGACLPLCRLQDVGQIVGRHVIRHADDIKDPLVHLLKIDMQRMQQLCRIAVDIPHQRQQNVLRPDVRGVKVLRLHAGSLQRRHCPRRIAVLLRRLRAAFSDQLLHQIRETLLRDTTVLQDNRGCPFAAGEKPQQDVLGSDTLHVIFFCQLTRFLQRKLCRLRIFVVTDCIHILSF